MDLKKKTLTNLQEDEGTNCKWKCKCLILIKELPSLSKEFFYKNEILWSNYLTFIISRVVPASKSMLIFFYLTWLATFFVIYFSDFSIFSPFHCLVFRILLLCIESKTNGYCIFIKKSKRRTTCMKLPTIHCKRMLKGF